MKCSILCGFGFLAMIFAAFLSGSCSQPILESSNCAEARDNVKRLYSLHLDQGPNPGQEKLELLRGYLSGALFDKLSKSDGRETDYLTQYVDFPKAFRVGACRDTANGPEFEVLLFWRREEKNFEEKIFVTAVKEKNWVIQAVKKENK